MSKKVVIAGSVSLEEKIHHWKKVWEARGAVVTSHPILIPKETFFEEYPKVHANFFRNMTETDILFVMNEDKNGVAGYLGAESFAEMCFAVAQNLINDKHIQVILLQMPDRSVQSYDEIVLWLRLGWLTLYQDEV